MCCILLKIELLISSFMPTPFPAAWYYSGIVRTMVRPVAALHLMLVKSEILRTHVRKVQSNFFCKAPIYFDLYMAR